MNKTIHTETMLNTEETDGAASLPSQVPSAPSSAVSEAAAEKWEKAGIGNAFIFGKVMSANTSLLLELLQLSLPEMDITEISDAGQEVFLKTSIDAHGVRLDISVQDSRGNLFDVEMQLKDESNIPRRIRYYTGSLDQTNLKPGESYNKLKDTVVIFITTFDPFGKDRYRYTFRNICLEENERLELGDGTTKVILNAAGSRGKISSALKGFLDLVMGITLHADGSYADRVQKQVIAAKCNSVWRREYMNWEMTLTLEREKGEAKGEARGEVKGALEKLILQISRKQALGQPVDRIAEDLVEDPSLVSTLYTLIQEHQGAAPDEIYRLYSKSATN